MKKIFISICFVGLSLCCFSQKPKPTPSKDSLAAWESRKISRVINLSGAQKRLLDSSFKSHFTELEIINKTHSFDSLRVIAIKRSEKMFTEQISGLLTK